MPALCPECKNPPRYHSFCTRCAKLFRPARRKWDRFWVDREIAEAIREARSCLLTRKQTADKLNICTQTLEKYRKRFHIPPFPTDPPKRGIPRKSREWTAERIDHLRRMIIAGASPREAAAVFDVSVGAIAMARMRHDLPKFPHNKTAKKVWTSARIHKLADLRAARYSYAQIAPRLGTTRNAIASAVKHHLHEACP
jgi:hypothetical protein